MGLPAIEAIACGTPVVASAVGALPEIVGTAGILVEPRNPERLASALATVWADDRVHDGLVGLARDRAEATHLDGRRRRARDAPGLRDGRAARLTSGPRVRRRSRTRARGRAGDRARRLARPDGSASRSLAGGAGLPATNVIFEPYGMTWTNVWPTVSVTGLPFLSKKRVGEVRPVFFQVPVIVRPFVEIQAGPEPMTWSPRDGASSIRRSAARSASA